MYITLCFFFFNDTATTEIYTLSLHDALPISHRRHGRDVRALRLGLRGAAGREVHGAERRHQRRDRLHRDAHDERLARRHPALRAPRPVCGARQAWEDLVVHLRALAARGVEAEPEL